MGGEDTEMGDSTDSLIPIENIGFNESNEDDENVTESESTAGPNGLVRNIQLKQTKDKGNYELEKQNSKLEKKLKFFQVALAISFVIFVCGLIFWSYVTKPTDCTNGINRIQKMLESERKPDNRIILRPLWANEELKANATDLKPLSLPVTGVIAHHTSVGENRCFTIGELQMNHKL